MDIICSWRDAISDPPEDGKAILLHGANADELLVAYRRGTSWHEWEGLCIRIDPGDQWLDITDIPAVPRSKVQAALIDIICTADGCGNAMSYLHAVDIIRDHTGITPSVVKGSLTTETEVTP